MKKFTSFLILTLASSLPVLSQTIEGIVYDRLTNDPVYCASVYFNSTSTGTLSDLDGRFRIDISRYRFMPLTVSAIGYYSATIKDALSEKPLVVYLDQKLFELDEVVVNARSQARERKINMTIFVNEFIGTTYNALSCKILNEKDLRFGYDKGGDTMKAFASSPIHIHNKALGYEINYFLDHFEFCLENKYVSYNGNALFNEDTTLSQAELKIVERRRKHTYLGSRMHFFRKLWVDGLASTGFSVYGASDKRVLYQDIVYQKDQHSKYLHSDSNIGISYYNTRPESFIRFLKGMVYFDPTGYFDASSVIWEGEMARQRIADTLPFDYVPD